MKPTFLASALALASTVLAQDPPAPPGGFAIHKEADIPIQYSDGYKTLLDARYPTAAAPATGWPCIMVVHGGDGDRHRSWVVQVAEMMAGAGYVALAYDTAGNGVTQKLNPPGRRDEVKRIRDLAEIFYLAEQHLGARLDERRLAVMGKSGGGKHTLWAASYSGKPLPVTGFVTHMPKIMAAHSDIQVLDPVEDSLPQGVMMKYDWAKSMYDGLGPNDPLVRMMIAGDYPGLVRFMRSEPGVNFYSLLRQSDVPLFVSYAYDDAKHFVNINGDRFASLHPGVPRRYFQGTGGHGSQDNPRIGAQRRDFTRRWCDRFLKGIQNGVENEPFAEVAVLPAAPKDYLDGQTQWQARRSQVWPIAPTRRLYLRTGGKLATTPPTTIEAGPTLAHRVAPGYGMASFLKDPSTLPTAVPLVTTRFDTPAFAEPQELLGRTVVEVDVINTASEFQLQAALLDVEPSGNARFITSGFAAQRMAAPGRHRVRVEVGDVGYVVPAGHKLRLQLENMCLRRQPGNTHLFIVPYFTSCDLAVQIDPAFAPRVDLPLGPARASLTPRFERVSAAQGIAYDIRVDGTATRGGSFYQVFVGASGNWPGVVLPPRIPLNIDNWTLAGISLANTPVFQSFAGRLDANGRAKARFTVPPALATQLAGTRLSFALLGVDGNLGIFSANPIELIIEP